LCVGVTVNNGRLPPMAVAPIQELQFLIQSSYLTHPAGVALLGHETVICLAGLKSLTILRRNFEKTLKELRRNFEGTLKETLKYTSKFFGETFFTFSVLRTFIAQYCL
jgi:hypothetical protein